VYTEWDTDWGVPQLDDPAGADYLTVEAPREARVTAMVEDVKGRLLLTVQGRALGPGERVVLTYGDRGGGGPGSRAQTFLEGKRYFWVDVDADGTGAFVTLPDPPYVTVAGGPAAGLVVVAPSTVVAGAPFRLLVRAEDACGNPAQAYRGTASVRSEVRSLPSSAAKGPKSEVAPPRGRGINLPVAEHTFTAGDGGVRWLEECAAPEAGLYTITAVDEAAGLRAESNPIRCTEVAPRHRLNWGDPHGGQVALAAKIGDFFRYGRDVAGIDFAGYQRNDHVHSDADYAVQQTAEREFHAPGRFVPLPGFEWSGEPPMGGHHNVYFRRHIQPIRRNSHRGLADTSGAAADLPHVLDLFRAYWGADVVITPHVGGGHADLTYHEPALEPALEITSTHGTFEWFFHESLGQGYKLGVVGGSDSHDGRPGARPRSHGPIRRRRRG
jgi:hypothetical protein